MLRPVEARRFFVLLFLVTSCKGGCSDSGGAAATTAASAPAAGPSLSITPPQPLPPQAAGVMARLTTLKPKLDPCYLEAWGKDTRLKGTVRVQLIIEADGRVTDAKVTSQTGLNDTVSKCVEGVLKGATFDPPTGGKQAVVNVPIHFTTPSAPGISPDP